MPSSRGFRLAPNAAPVRAVVLTGEGKGFCSGGDVNAIIGELFQRDMPGLLEFTRMTCEVIRNMRQLRKPIVAAINGIAAGAGAVLALASDLRIASDKAKIAFLFSKVGLAGADMGAAFLLPRVVGLGRATELLYLGDTLDAPTAERYGLFNRVVPHDQLMVEARALAERLAAGPSFALGLTKEALNEDAFDGSGERARSRSAHPGHVYEDRGLPRGLRGVCRQEAGPLRGALMRLTFDSPLLEDRHREWGKRAAAIAPALPVEGDDVLALGRAAVAMLSGSGLFEAAVPEPHQSVEVRSLCAIREELAACSGLADSIFAVQGLGAQPVALGGSKELQAKLLPAAARGERVLAFALTEPDAGSDVASLSTYAQKKGDTYVLHGRKRFISNAGLADGYTVFARTSEGPKGISAFWVERESPGLTVGPQLPVIAPHPIAELELDGCEVPVAHRLGAEGDGMRLALATLDLFRTSVGAAAVGMARRALDEALGYATRRNQFGAPLAELQGVQFLLADSATELEASGSWCMPRRA